MNTTIAENGFVIIDLPVRFTNSEMQQLSLAMTRAIRREPGVRLGLPHDRLIAAIDEARRLVKLYREREKMFGDDLFTDPSWAILLDLLIAEGSTKRVSVSSACLGSRAPSTTALRHLATLQRNGFVVRHASASDQRVVHVRLSDVAIDAMCRLLTAP